MEEQKLHNIRHSLAHLLAIAVLKKDPQAKLAIGPVIDNGFYYDFSLSKPIGDKDLKGLEKTMKKTASSNLDVNRISFGIGTPGKNLTFSRFSSSTLTYSGKVPHNMVS